MYEPEPTVPCKICDEPTRMTGTKLCDGCWEVTHRIEYFLHFPKGKQFVIQLLGLAERASAGTERAAEPIPHNSDFNGRFQ
jgi:hypothetical protein